MGILSFSNFRTEKSKQSGGDWSQQEVADFYRAHGLLVQNGISIGIDRGLSDENEPWMVFFDEMSQDVFLHVARINHHCFLICDPLNLRLNAPDIKSLIERFETSVRKYLEINAENSKNVLIHPAARIIMSISAVFLLFKLENSEAKAYGAPNKIGEAEATGSAVRHIEKSSSIVARAQSAAARIFEQVDTPVNIAVLASVVLLGEIAQAQSETQDQDQGQQKNLDVTQTLIAPSAANKEYHVDNKAIVSQDDGADFKVDQAQDTSAIQMIELPLSSDTLVFDAVPQKELEKVEIDEGDFLMKIPFSHFSLLDNDPDMQLVLAEGKDKTGSQEQVYDEAVALIEKIFGQTAISDLIDSKAQIIETISGAIRGDSKPNSENLPKDLIAEISAALLHQIKDHAGFFIETAYEGEKLYNLLQYFADKMGSYQIDFDGKKILIEDSTAEQLLDDDIGLWTNNMADGVTVSVIGRADLIDDILTIYQ